MEPRLIQPFVAIAVAEHSGRALTRLGIAQPVLSRRIRLLERGTPVSSV
jgi:DNA-binding transcriptional LysR family regulator